MRGKKRIDLISDKAEDKYISPKAKISESVHYEEKKERKIYYDHEKENKLVAKRRPPNKFKRYVVYFINDNIEYKSKELIRYLNTYIYSSKDTKFIFKSKEDAVIFGISGGQTFFIFDKVTKQVVLIGYENQMCQLS